MRPSFRLRGLRAAHLTIAPIMLAAPASAVALTADHTAPDRRATTLSTHVTPRHVALGRAVEISGHAARQSGATIELETARHAGGRWGRLATTRIGRHGGWAVHAHPRESFIVRAVEVVAASRRVAAGGDAVTTASHPAAVSRSTRVEVRARMQVAARERSAIADRDAAISGRLLPGRAGRVIAVQASSSRGWHTVGHGRTGGHGGFAVRFAPPAGAGRHLRVVFAGDRRNAATTRGAGTLTLYSPTVVSWYDDAGSTACGFHATDGVANRTLPCGTKVHFRRGGRTVTATVDDRGPYVYGREFDLNQNTAGALGFAGVGTVEASIG